MKVTLFLMPLLLLVCNVSTHSHSCSHIDSDDRKMDIVENFKSFAELLHATENDASIDKHNFLKYVTQAVRIYFLESMEKSCWENKEAFYEYIENRIDNEVSHNEFLYKREKAHRYVEFINKFLPSEYRDALTEDEASLLEDFDAIIKGEYKAIKEALDNGVLPALNEKRVALMSAAQCAENQKAQLEELFNGTLKYVEKIKSENRNRAS